MTFGEVDDERNDDLGGAALSRGGGLVLQAALWLSTGRSFEVLLKTTASHTSKIWASYSPVDRSVNGLSSAPCSTFCNLLP